MRRLDPAAKGQADRSGRVTIQQVADAAGVSIATVSRVMSRNETVRPDLADRVRRAADALGYHPSAAAQGLATGVSRMVGVIVPNLANPYFYDIIKAMNAAAAGDGYRMLIADANEDADEELELGRGLLRQVDALVLVSPRMPVAALHELDDRSRNVVLVNRASIGIGLPTVSVDNFGAMLGLAGHLATLGHRQVAYLGGPPQSWQAQERQRAVEQAAAFGLRSAVVPAGATIEAGYAAVDQALTTDPSALICFSDLVAFGALARLDELGIEVPHDLSLTGFDDIVFAKYARPRLTTATNPQQQLGATAWQLVTQVMRRERPTHQPLLVAPLVIRESTAPPSPSRART
jgi:LacI family transcriptional regulator, repressor for deo operon, udp, cdd, tsx, nupC, and nupG